MRVRSTFTIVMLLSALFVLVPTPLPASAGPDAPVADEWAFLDLLNAERTNRSMPALRMQTDMTNVGRKHAVDMANAGYIYHRSDLTQGAPDCWTRIGENVGVGGSPQSLHDAFMNSPGHRANILGDFRHVGIGVEYRNGRLWVAVQFLKASCSVPLEARPTVTAPFGKTSLNGVSVATGTLYSDFDRVFASGRGQLPRIRVFDSAGTLVSDFKAYPNGFKGGLNVATGDVDGDGVDEIVVGPRTGGGPHVRVFERDGTVHEEFFAYPRSMKGGVNVATADIDGDGRDEVVTVPFRHYRSELRFWRLKSVRLIKTFQAYSRAWKGGAYIDGGRIDNRGNDVVIMGPGRGGGAHVRVIDPSDLREVWGFFAYPRSWKYGAIVGIGDPGGDGYERLIVVPGPGGPSQLKEWTASRTLVRNFSPYSGYNGGMSIGASPQGLAVSTFNDASRSKAL